MALLSKKLIAALAFAAAASVALPPAASALDDKQKEEMGAFIKEYLLANPELFVEMRQALVDKQEAAQRIEQKAAVSQNEAAIFSSADDITLGNPKGDVTVVEFFDYNCGYCKRGLQDMDALLESDPNLKFVLKELPILGPDSLAAHKVSAAFRLLAPEKYGDFHRALLGGKHANEEIAVALAVKLGVAETDLRAKMDATPYKEQVDGMHAMAGTLGISGTPAYVIGKEIIPGAVGAEDIAAKINNIRSCGEATC
ncbi:DsbA family protein [Pararhizobium sp.]|uniref:DsbA family protein n=1 Tax=Pararhizobium sp. TaxID=1977563 RepID=UPI00271FB9C2|nr:DsbA family protein [Pararhizobium sp.]MDO9415869.1 DsbA family protein [Pararhizobium sp.]